jgi:alpha-1,2-mannosyltransferase
VSSAERGRAAVTAARQSALSRPDPAAPARRPHGSWLLAIGAAAFAVALAVYVGYATTHPSKLWIEPVDLRVYTDGGLIVRHLAPLYHAHLSSPLYSRPVNGQLQFTYPPFAALVFTVLSLFPFTLLTKIAIAVNVAALLATIEMTFGGLGYPRGRARMGASLLLAAALFWTEPVQRTLWLGQIELVLMALIIWDQCQPDRRWWKGAGIGIAAGIKLVPLIFIPYLLLTRRFRQAGVAAGTFAATVVLGYAVLPADSSKWWLGGLFYQDGRTGFPGWLGNQSLRGLITRLVGSVAGAQPVWLVAAVMTAALGLACAAILDRAGHRMAGLLCCALTGLLISPISWDHHWVWIVPAVALAAHYAIRSRSAAARWTAAGLAIGIVLIFGAWPKSLWGRLPKHPGFFEGFIWAPANTDPSLYYRYGDRPSYAEYHWRGFYLIVGNLYVLAGMALLVMMLVFAARMTRAARTAQVARTAVASAAGGPPVPSATA